MKLYEILGLIILILIGITAVKYLKSPRFRLREGFESPKVELNTNKEATQLSPDYIEGGPAHILKDKIEITRPFNEMGILTQKQCYEQDGNRIPEILGDYNQRTNNYRHTYPDSCSAPLKEMVGSFYAPRQGAIGSPVPKGNKVPESSKCQYAQ
jgi:hypothetical protein